MSDDEYLEYSPLEVSLKRRDPCLMCGQSINCQKELAAALQALRHIQQLNYTAGATNFAAYQAHMIATHALARKP